VLVECEGLGWEPTIPEQDRATPRTWEDKPKAQQRAYDRNAKRVASQHGKALLRCRGQTVERSFAHVCETGGGRRVWLRGLDKVRKWYLLRAAAYNLGVLMQKLVGVGTPRSLQGACAAVFAWVAALARWPGVIGPLRRYTEDLGLSTTPQVVHASATP
jgi:transposase